MLQQNSNSLRFKQALLMLLFSLITVKVSFSQQNSNGLSVKLLYSNDSTVTVKKSIANPVVLASFLKEEQLKAYKKGLLAYSVDSITTADSLLYRVYIQTGTVYHWGTISWNIEEGILQKSGLNPEKLNGLQADPKHIYTFFEKVLNYYENNGYPFASIQLKNIKSNGDSISGSLEISAGEAFVYDTLAIHGDAKINNSYLQHYLGILEGGKYREKDFKSISKKIKELPFGIEMQKPSVEFIDKKALIHIYLTKKSANFFNGILGILPNSPQLQGITSGSNVLITGDLKLTLINSLRTGEKMDVSWKRLKPETQRLKTEFSFPYLFNTSFGVDDELDLLKQDTSFINFSNQLGLLYALSSNKSLKVFWERKSTTLLSENTTNAAELLGNNSNSYGIDFSFEQLDYKYNPTKGIRFNAVFQGGTRTLDGTDSEDESKTPISYPSDNSNITITAIIPKSSTILKGELNIEVYLPIYKIMTLKIASQNAYINNPHLFDNDLNRLGGFHLLRGFDEQSIFSSFYSVLTLEYRLLLEQNSFIGLFFDQAYTERYTFLNEEADLPFGFGASINFQTKPGVFSIMYAVGRQQNNPISFTSAKIHFGFISLF